MSKILFARLFCPFDFWSNGQLKKLIFLTASHNWKCDQIFLPIGLIERKLLFNILTSLLRRKLIVFIHFSGVWVYATLIPTLIVNSKPLQHNLTSRDYTGLAIWVVGFAIEVLADYQKFVFKNDPNNAVGFTSDNIRLTDIKNYRLPFTYVAFGK